MGFTVCFDCRNSIQLLLWENFIVALGAIAQGGISSLGYLTIQVKDGMPGFDQQNKFSAVKSASDDSHGLLRFCGKRNQQYPRNGEGSATPLLMAWRK